MTVYNRDRYLAAAVESVLAQTYNDFELLIWDDESTDNSVEIARHYEKHDKRVKVVAAQHQGQTRSLKQALAATQGTYIGWVDSDDLLAPTALSETVAILDAHREVGLVYTDYLDIDENDRVKGYGHRCRLPYSKERLLVDFMTFHFRLMRREAYELVGGLDESFERAQDYDLCLRLSEVTEFFSLKKPLYYYRHHNQSVSNLHQVEQIMASKEAIARALVRRGMSEQYELNVQIFGKYQLMPKSLVLVSP
jgi:glycosyltransferase involved in cell wall biosynthesis